MKLPEPNPDAPAELRLRFPCGGCGHELEAPLAYAGVAGPCPMCGTVVQAPGGEEGSRQPSGVSGQRSAAIIPLPPLIPLPPNLPIPHRKSGLHLPPLNEDTGLVDFPGDFWEDGEGNAAVSEESPPEEGQPPIDPFPATGGPHLRPPPGIPPVPQPNPVVLPEPRQRVLPTRDEEEAAATAGARKQQWHLRFFDAALILLFLGTLAMGGAALAFTQSKKAAPPVAPPELSRQVMERMEQTARQRDQAVQEARSVMQHWLTALEPEALENWCLPGEPVPALPGMADGTRATGTAGPTGSSMGPPDFEFIQARRLPGTDRFLTMFEVLTDPPMVVPVEETPAGPRLHGRAIAQQQSGTLAKFLASQGQGEAVFYVLLRPGPAPLVEELLRTRPDLKPFLHVAAEPAFPADGPAACLACLAPDSAAAAIFAKRAHDPGLRPAVVKLAWRQHRESGNYVELVSFEPNAWSRH